jgi:Glycosyl hydrolase family 3 N terminal domain
MRLHKSGAIPNCRTKRNILDVHVLPHPVKDFFTAERTREDFRMLPIEPGGVNLTREPRDGRTFEYMGEDPILAGTMVGNRIKCEQAQHVIADIKHYAVNDQEGGRDEVNVLVGERALRESDLLAFQIGIATGNPGAVIDPFLFRRRGRGKAKHARESTILLAARMV